MKISLEGSDAKLTESLDEKIASVKVCKSLSAATHDTWWSYAYVFAQKRMCLYRVVSGMFAYFSMHQCSDLKCHYLKWYV